MYYKYNTWHKNVLVLSKSFDIHRLLLLPIITICWLWFETMIILGTLIYQGRHGFQIPISWMVIIATTDTIVLLFVLWPYPSDISDVSRWSYPSSLHIIDSVIYTQQLSIQLPCQQQQHHPQQQNQHMTSQSKPFSLAQPVLEGHRIEKDWLTTVFLHHFTQRHPLSWPRKRFKCMIILNSILSKRSSCMFSICW